MMWLMKFDRMQKTNLKTFEQQTWTFIHPTFSQHPARMQQENTITATVIDRLAKTTI